MRADLKLTGMIATTYDLRTFAASIDRDGWAVVGPVLDNASIAALREEVASLTVDGRGGARNLLDHAAVRALAAAPRIRAFATTVLGDDCFAIRALLFDKTPSANWKVVWHQDLTIATRAAADLPGFGPWTEKGGAPVHIAMDDSQRRRSTGGARARAGGRVPRRRRGRVGLSPADSTRVCASGGARTSKSDSHRICNWRVDQAARVAGSSLDRGTTRSR